MAVYSLKCKTRIRSKAHFHLILERQYQSQCDSGISVQSLNWPHGYFGAAAHHGNYVAPYPGSFRSRMKLLRYAQPSTSSSTTFPELRLYIQVFETDPYNISRQVVTSFILSHLQPIPTPLPQHSLTTHIADLPPELRNSIRDDITAPFGIDPSLEPTYYFPDNKLAFWLTYLTRRVCFPWLWDLDPAQCEHKDRQPPPNGASGWDWERLIRMLAQVNVFEVRALVFDFRKEGKLTLNCG